MVCGVLDALGKVGGQGLDVVEHVRRGIRPVAHEVGPRQAPGAGDDADGEAGGHGDADEQHADEGRCLGHLERAASARDRTHRGGQQCGQARDHARDHEEDGDRRATELLPKRCRRRGALPTPPSRPGPADDHDHRQDQEGDGQDGIVGILRPGTRRSDGRDLCRDHEEDQEEERGRASDVARATDRPSGPPCSVFISDDRSLLHASMLCRGRQTVVRHGTGQWALGRASD